MIELLVFFLGVYGALGAPHTPHLDHDADYHLDNVVIDGQLPGTENLSEKALPISRLPTVERNNLPAHSNLAEKSQVPRRLPGTENLAEKRIPDLVLKRFQPSDVK